MKRQSLWRLVRTAAQLGVVAAITAGSLAAAPRHRALLVGVSEYEHLPEWNLEGPPNDVELLASVLQETPLSIPRESITTLGWPATAPRPTKDNIVRELEKLAREEYAPGDQVMILLAGHGSQQPADPSPDDLETDGLDELFLPADAKNWNRQIGVVENALTDDELHRSLVAIRNRGAFVWLVVDSCHSGTMTRGRVEKQRYIPPDKLIPADVLTRVADRNVSAVAAGASPELSPTAADLVALYAAHADQTTPEAPWLAADGPVYGLFTYTLAEVLRKASGRLTYWELAEAITERYRSLGRSIPTPLLEGGGIDREVLGTAANRRSNLRIAGAADASSTRYRIAAGQLDGLTVGSVLAVLGQDDAASEPQAFLRIFEVAPLESKGVVVSRAGGDEWMEVPASSAVKLEAGARCALEYWNFGDMHLEVAVQSAASSADLDPVTHASGRGPAPIERAVADVTGAPDSVIRRVDDPATADWLIRDVAGEVVLVPASGWERDAVPGASATGAESAPPKFRVGPIDDPGLGRQLGTSMQRIARAHHLLGLAGSSVQGAAEDVQVELQILRFADSSDLLGSKLKHDDRVFRPGDEIAFHLFNRSIVPVDVTLLYVSSAYEIRPLFPSRGEMNRLGPGEELGPLFRTRVNANTLGEEQVVVIAVRADGAVPRNYIALAQPSLDQQRSTRGRQATALDRLFETALYGSGATRGLNEAEAAEYAVTLAGWLTAPQ